MPTTRVRHSRSFSPLSRRRLFQLNASKSSTFTNTDSNHDSLSDVISTRIPKRFISKELILLDTFLKKKSSSIIRRMLAFDSDPAQLTDAESITIGSESDDDATLVAGPFVKELENYEPFTKGFEAEQLDNTMPSVMLGKKIRDYLPGCSADENDDGAVESTSSLDDEPSIEEASDNPSPSPPPSCPINFWSSRNEIFDAPGFEIVKDDDRIAYATALSPPPWHRPKQSMLVYEPASPDDDEIPCPTNGEPVHAHFSW